LGKIGVLKKAARITDHFPEFKVDWLEMRIYALAAGGFQGAEQPIAPQIAIRLCLGHWLSIPDRRP
jgi:hypothetical protein